MGFAVMTKKRSNYLAVIILRGKITILRGYDNPQERSQKAGFV